MFQRNQLYWFGALLLGMPHILSADAGFPMIIFLYPEFLALFIPLIYLEAFVLQTRIGVDHHNALKASFVSNFISTVIGFPLLYGVILGIAYSVHSAYLSNTIALIIYVSPFANGELLALCGFTVLMVFYFILSYLIESSSVNHMLGEDFEEKLIKKAVFWANVWSYVWLWAQTVGFWIFGLFLGSYCQYDVSSSGEGLGSDKVIFVLLIGLGMIWSYMLKTAILGKKTYVYIIAWMFMMSASLTIYHVGMCHFYPEVKRTRKMASSKIDFDDNKQNEINVGGVAIKVPKI